VKAILKIINSDKVTLAYLNNLESGIVRQVINGEYVISFVALIEELKTELLHDENNLIEYDNDYFRVIHIEEEHDSDNMLKVYIDCEHISYDLIQLPKASYTQTDRSAIYVMNDLLTDSGFNFIGTDVTTTASIDIQQETNIKNLLYQVAVIWQGELSYFRNDIELKQQLGQNRGADFRFGKNIQNIKRLIDRVENTVSYEVEVVQGTELEELGYFQLGDTIRVVDDMLNIEINIRIIELTKDLVTGLNSRIVLGQPIKDLSTGFNNIFNSVK
jgi:phage-related protein